MHIEIQIKIEIKRWIPFLLHACMYCILKMQAGIWNNTDAWSQLQHRRAVNTSGKKGEAYHGLDYIIKLLASLAFAPRFAMQLVPQFIDVHLHLFWNILYTIFLAASMTATRFKRTQFSAAIWRWEPGIFFPPTTWGSSCHRNRCRTHAKKLVKHEPPIIIWRQRLVRFHMIKSRRQAIAK